MRKNITLLLSIAVLCSLAFASGCYNDDCEEACRDGYSCYYGICLNRGFCPESDPHTVEHCLVRDEDNNCTEWSPHWVCDEDYSCECIRLNAEGQCADRRCIHVSELDE